MAVHSMAALARDLSDRLDRQGHREDSSKAMASACGGSSSSGPSAAEEVDQCTHACWEMRHGGIDWDQQKRIAMRTPSGNGNCMAYGPELPTRGKVVIRLRVAGCGSIGPSAPRGSHICVGVALDGRHGPVMAARFLHGVLNNHRCPPGMGFLPGMDPSHIVDAERQERHENVKVLASHEGEIAGRTLTMTLEAGKLSMCWDGDEPKVSGRMLPDHVRPWILLFCTQDAIELVSIRTHWLPGAAVAFGIVLRRWSQRGLHVPADLAQRIWELAVA